MCHAVRLILHFVAARLAEAPAPPTPPALAAAPALQRRRARTGTPQQRRQGRPHEGSRPPRPPHCRPLPPDPRRQAELLRWLPCHLVRGAGAAPPGGSLAVLRRRPMLPHWRRQWAYLRRPRRLVQCRTRRPAFRMGTALSGCACWGGPGRGGGGGGGVDMACAKLTLLCFLPLEGEQGQPIKS